MGQAKYELRDPPWVRALVTVCGIFMSGGVLLLALIETEELLLVRLLITAVGFGLLVFIYRFIVHNRIVGSAERLGDRFGLGSECCLWVIDRLVFDWC